MKSGVTTIVKISSLSILLSFLVFGLYAQNKYVKILASNDNMTSYKTLPKKTNLNATKVAFLNDWEITEEQKEIESWMHDENFWEIQSNVWDEEVIEEERKVEDWMLNLDLKNETFSEERYIEEWMFDEFFWEIKTDVWNEEVIEEEGKVEDWMKNLEIVKKRSAKYFHNFREEQWMKKHAFLIL